MDQKPKTLEDMNLGRAAETFMMMMRAGRKIKHHLMMKKSFGELTPTQFFAMLFLLHMGPQPQGKVCDRIKRSPGNLTLVIDNLEKNHWVERRRDPNDRRVVLVALTEAGEELIRNTDVVHREMIEQEMKILSEDELETLYHLVKKIDQGYEDEHLD